MHAHILPLLFLNETNNQRQPTLAVLSNSSLFCTGNAPAPLNLDRSPTTSPRVLKPSMFMAYFSVVPTAIGMAIQTTRTRGFVLVCVAPGSGQGGVDNETEVLVVRHPRRILWKTFGRIFDEQGQKSLLGPELYGTRLSLSHVLFVDFYKIQWSAPGLSTTRETSCARDPAGC